MSVSPTDILTALKNTAQALFQYTTSYLNVEGQLNAAGLTATTVVKSQAGRIAQVVVIIAGSASGHVYDAVDTATTTRPLFVIPMTVGVYIVNMPATYGIVVAPGSGQTITVSFS